MSPVAGDKAPHTFTPFSFYIEAFDTTEYISSGLRYINIRVDQAFLGKIARRHAICEAESLSECLENCSPTAWHQAPHSPDDIDHDADFDQPAEVNSWHLGVTEKAFFFVGRGNSGERVASRMISSAGLALWLDGAPVGQSRYRRIGNILLNTGGDMDEFVNVLTSCCPEVAAALIEDEMTKQIATTLEADKSSTHISADRGSPARTRKTRI